MPFKSLFGRSVVTAVLFASATVAAQPGIISTAAGNGTPSYGGDGGPATSALLSGPDGVTIDAAGNIYISDRNNSRIRKIAPSGIITTIAGTGTAGYGGDGGPAIYADINHPGDLVIDNAGNIYFGDVDNNRIRKINTSGVITTVAGSGTPGYSGDGGPATAATLNIPIGVALDNAGNLYIGDHFNHRIRKVNAAGIITTIAGNGTMGYGGDGGASTGALLNYPNYLSTDVSGNLYIADNGNHRIRKINTSGIITTIAGTGIGGFSGDGGPATSAQLAYPAGTAVDADGNIYVTDYNNNRIRVISPSGTIHTVAGNGTPGFSGDGGPATAASLKYPIDVALNSSGMIAIADYQNDRLRMVGAPSSISYFAGPPETMNLFPDPSAGIFHLYIPSACKQRAKVLLSNILGQKVFETSVVTNSDATLDLDLVPGVYLLDINTGTERYTQKITISK